MNGCVSVIQALSANSLFLLFNDQTSSNTVIEIVHTDGSSPYILTTLPILSNQQQVGYTLHSSADAVDRVAQSPWFNFSRDGRTYALERDSYGCDSCSTEGSILIGSMNGSDPTAIATAGGSSVSVVGWTTM